MLNIVCACVPWNQKLPRPVFSVPDRLFQAVLQTCTAGKTAGQFDEASSTWAAAGSDASWAIPAARVQLVVSSPTSPSENAIVFDVPSMQC